MDAHHTGNPNQIGQIGSRHGLSKDMVLAKEATHLWILSDILTLPKWIPYRVAFSIGDVLIAVGVFVYLLQSEASGFTSKKVVQQENKS